MGTDAKPKGKPKGRGPSGEMKPLPSGCEALMTREDVARALRLSTRTLDKMVAAGEYPAHDAEIGGKRRWRREHHDAWVRRLCGVDPEERSPRH